MRKLNQRFAWLCAMMILAVALAASRIGAVGAPLSITEADDGETIDLMKDDSLVITLEANSSTGYRWQILKNNDAIMKLSGSSDYQGGKPDQIGTPGHAALTFSAIATGKETLELGYSRPTDHDPAKTFTVNIRVSEP